MAVRNIEKSNKEITRKNDAVVDYEYKFNEYGITHVMTYSNSKLNSLIEKDQNYKLLYEDDDFVIYERESMW